MPDDASRRVTHGVIAAALELCRATGPSVAETREIVAETRMTIARSRARLDRMNRVMPPEPPKGASA